jgi:hypothetical protein
LMNLLRYAALLACQQHKPAIDLPMLAQAFEKRLARHLKGKANPFVTPAGEWFVAPEAGKGRAGSSSLASVLQGR